jgi:hypothetical protein
MCMPHAAPAPRRSACGPAEQQQQSIRSSASIMLSIQPQKRLRPQHKARSGRHSGWRPHAARPREQRRACSIAMRRLGAAAHRRHEADGGAAMQLQAPEPGMERPSPAVCMLEARLAGPASGGETLQSRILTRRSAAAPAPAPSSISRMPPTCAPAAERKSVCGPSLATTRKARRLAVAVHGASVPAWRARAADAFAVLRLTPPHDALTQVSSRRQRGRAGHGVRHRC